MVRLKIKPIKSFEPSDVTFTSFTSKAIAPYASMAKIKVTTRRLFLSYTRTAMSPTYSRGIYSAIQFAPKIISQNVNLFVSS